MLAQCLRTVSLTVAVVTGASGYALAAPAAKAPAAAPPAAAPKPAQVTPAPDKPATAKPAAEKTTAEKPTAEKATTDKPAADKPAADKPAADKPAAAKPDPASHADADAAPTVKAPPPAPVSADALALQYQRVGHELAELLAKRGVGHALDQCNDLDADFHTIKLSEALATPESRITAAATLTALHERIQRWQGIQIARECLNNPLAPQCQ